MAHLNDEVNNDHNETETVFSNDQGAILPGNKGGSVKTTIKATRSVPGVAYPQVSAVDSNVTYSPDEFTVVTSSGGKPYTKVVVFSDEGVYQGKVGYTGHFEHTAENIAVPTMRDLETAIRSMCNRVTACVIRAQVFDELAGQSVRRTNSGEWKASGWQEHCFAEVPRSWACIDVDGKGDGEVIFPGAKLWTEATTSKERVTQVASWLVNTWMPKNFHHKDAVVQWSSSYGLDGRLERVRAHVWVRFTAPLGSVLLGKWIKDVVGPTLASDGLPYVPKTESGKDVPGARRLDYSTVRTNVQPNFTAAPVFNRGGTLVPHPEKAGEFIGVKGGVSFDDPHADYRVIRVNGNGSFGYAVDAQSIIDDMTALWAKENEGKEAKDGQVKSVSDAPAQLSMLDWTAKDRADYDLAEYALSFLKEGHVDNYDGWVAKGIELKSRFPGAEGLSLWTQWSLTWSGATADEIAWECEQKWSTFTPVRVGRSRGFGSLIRDARAAGMASDHGFVLPSKATKAMGKTTTEEKTGEAPALPPCLAKLTEAPKSKSEYKVALMKALLVLRTDNEAREAAQAHFEYMGAASLQEFLAALVVNGAAADKVAQISRALQPPAETSLSLPTVNGAPIGFTEVSGFVVGDSGVSKEVFTELGERTLVPILRTPMFVLSEDEPIDLGQATGVRLTLCWRNHGVWTTYRVPVQDVSEKSKIVAALAPLGVQITSADAAAVVAYIAAYRHCNAMNIAHNIYTTRLGWQSRHGEIVGFMLGTTWMPVLGQTLEVQYQPESEGMVADAESFAQTKGDKDAWVGMLNGLADHPIAAAMVYAACCAPLLAVVGCQGFTLDLGGKTSTGKTTAMRVAASVWGSPVDGDSRKVFSNWKTTANAVEARCARSNDLPLMLDDTKEASHASVTSEVVYMITNGQAKARGTQTGGYRTGFNFRKVLISTGENLILDTNEHGGVRARVVSLSDLPFGAKSEAGGKLTRSLRDSAGSHYGHAGRLIVDYLCATKDDWAELREEYKAECAKLQETTGEDGVNSRVAEYVVLMRLAGKLLCDLTGATLPVEAHIDAIWAQCSKASTQSDPSTNALSLVWNYVAKQPHRLEGSTSAPMNDLVPNGGWLGRRGQKEGKAVVYVLPDELKKVLQDAGHNFNALTRSWSDDGLIASDKEGKHSVKVRIAGTPLRALCFNLDAVLSALGVSETNPYENDTDSPI